MGEREDQQEICDATVDQMVRSIVKLGGSYADVMEALQEARKGGYLESKLVVNALARPDRTIIAMRDGNEVRPSTLRPANPVPELFTDRLEKGEKKRRYMPDEIEPEDAEKEESEESVYG